MLGKTGVDKDRSTRSTARRTRSAVSSRNVTAGSTSAPTRSCGRVHGGRRTAVAASAKLDAIGGLCQARGAARGQPARGAAPARGARGRRRRVGRDALGGRVSASRRSRPATRRAPAARQRPVIAVSATLGGGVPFAAVALQLGLHCRGPRVGEHVTMKATVPADRAAGTSLCRPCRRSTGASRGCSTFGSDLPEPSRQRRGSRRPAFGSAGSSTRAGRPWCSCCALRTRT